MCVILIGRINEALHELALQRNGDGFSVFTAEEGLIKAPTPAQVERAFDTFAIWHYRLATSGNVGESNIHPFPICHGEYLLYHNGVLGDGVGELSDTAALAKLLYDVDLEVAMPVVESLSRGNRFLIASATDPKNFRVFGDWEFDAGVLMSHKMYKYPAYKTYVDGYFEEYASQARKGKKKVGGDDVDVKALKTISRR